MAQLKEQPMKREHDSMDDFEHLEHVQDGHSNQPEVHTEKIQGTLEQNFDTEKDMINFSLNQSSIEPNDPKQATLLLLDSEKVRPVAENKFEVRWKEPESDLLTGNIEDQSEVMGIKPLNRKEDEKQQRVVEKKEEEIKEIKVANREPEIVSSAEKKTDDSWNVLEKPEPVLEKPQSAVNEEKKVESINEYLLADMEKKVEIMNELLADMETKEQTSAPDTGESEFESEVEASPIKSFKPIKQEARREKVEEVEIAPKEIFSSIGIVAALIYWRDPKESGAVFGGILSVLLSLAYFSLISVLAYLSLLVLTGTIAFRIYKTVLQAVQKTSDGHPFKDILELDLTVPAEKVHEVADVAVAHANAAVSELRRLFLVEDFVDSLKFGVLLWCLTYVGSWFNGMTLIIIGVVALFTLPKVYETNKTQIDQNLALVHGKINELTAKVKAAIPLGKKEPTKEE
ncbi:PREDICTED: reticulon-1 isoform X2 [Dufourea novaeangliae]|uniref:reticulon-1 isoform X2 n=1 Tax=Dufourea novaeangliae TaxID=178035 RepID=UPI000767DB73|nr:PREDICTED: reticulon-1 isoform X2 [Dufourea novaeangliae]